VSHSCALFKLKSINIELCHPIPPALQACPLRWLLEFLALAVVGYRSHILQKQIISTAVESLCFEAECWGPNHLGDNRNPPHTRTSREGPRSGLLPIMARMAATNGIRQLNQRRINGMRLLLLSKWTQTQWILSPLKWQVQVS
jgi:hypothetical protein